PASRSRRIAEATLQSSSSRLRYTASISLALAPRRKAITEYDAQAARFSLPADDAPRAGVEAEVGHASHMDAAARVVRVDHLPAADVEPDVAETVEEDEVAGPQGADDVAAGAELVGRDAGQRDAHPGEHVLDEAGAVEPGGRGSAPAVGHADEAAGDP